MTEYIRGFKNEHRFLSNFWPAEVEFEGKKYPTVEHAYQAAKFEHNGYRKVIRKAETPGIAKKLGSTRAYPIHADWNEGRAIAVMSDLLAQKFSDPELAKRLLDTDDAVLVETNSWGDDTWGDSTTTDEPGRNQLGILLMSVRASLRWYRPYFDFDIIVQFD